MAYVVAVAVVVAYGTVAYHGHRMADADSLSEAFVAVHALHQALS